MRRWHCFRICAALFLGSARLLPGGGQQALSDESLCLVAEQAARGPVYSLAWSPDAIWLAAAGYGQVGIFDNTGRPRALLPEPESFVWSLSFSPDGALLAAADQEGSVWLYDTGDWSVAARLKTGFAYALAFAPDGRRLAVGTETGVLQIWDLAARTQVGNLEHAERVLSLSWSSRRNLMAVGLWNGDVIIRDGDTYQPADSYTNSGNSRRDVNGLGWSPDGRRLAAAHQDARIRIYRPGRDAPEGVLPGHVGWVRGVSWSPDGRLLASGGNDRRIRVWQARPGRLPATLERQAYPIWSVAFAPRGNLLAAGSGLYGDPETPGRIVIYELLP
jgi:WD40 repeat protein